MIAGPETIARFLDELIAHLETRNAVQSELHADFLATDLQRLLTPVTSRTKGSSSEALYPAAQIGVGVERTAETARIVYAVRTAVRAGDFDRALTECRTARELW